MKGQVHNNNDDDNYYYYHYDDDDSEFLKNIFNFEKFLESILVFKKKYSFFSS